MGGGHFLDESVAPGPPSFIDPVRADASRWIEGLPVIQAFRARVLRRSKRPRRVG